jgi:rhodanese-related sulfurtransferase
MKRKYSTIFLAIGFIFSFISGFPGCKTSEETENQVNNISVSEAFELIQNNLNNGNFIILDVRTPQEYQQSHIKNAVNIDYNSENFENLLNELDKNKTVLVYCQSGNRSSIAANVMINIGFSDIYNMLGGISAWISAGYPVISSTGLINTGVQISNR